MQFNVGEHQPFFKRGVAVVAAAVILTGCGVVYENHQDRSVDVLQDSHWQLGGVTAEGNQLAVAYIGGAIVEQDGSPGQANPAVNLYGSRLAVDGDFSVTYKLSDIDGTVGVSLYGTPPLVEDEFRAELGTLDINLDGDTFNAGVSTAEGRNLATTSGAVKVGDSHTLTVNESDGSLSFEVDGKTVGDSIDSLNIFDSGQAWFGFDARTSGGSYKVTSLQAEGGVENYDTRQQRVSQAADGLAALASQKRPGFLFGAAVAPGPMLADETYRQLLGNYNAYSIENAAKWQFIHPAPDVYDFSQTDAIVDMAEQAGATVHGHALIFGEALPAWTTEQLTAHPEQAEQLMADYITTVVGHYKGRVHSWDVVNEPLADYDTEVGQDGLRKNVWYEALGPDYITIALRAAHAADPSAELWFNDFGMESDDMRFNDMLALAQRLQADGVPLTGVGFQSHIDEGDTIENDTLRQRVEALAAIGLKSRFSEVDITNDSEHAIPAQILSVCISEPSCVGMTTWGVTDRYSSGGELTDNGGFEPGSGLLWNVKGQATESLADIHKFLKN